MGGWVRAAGSAASAAVIAGVIALSVRQFPGLARFQPLLVYAVLWAAFAAGAWLVLGVCTRRAVPLILLGGIAIQLAALSAPPQGSDDLYRYIWDGRVQAAGIDPYRYAPAAPQLTGLREPFLWPANGPYCVGSPHKNASPEPVASLGPVASPQPGLPSGCTRINRPRVHTIYPPVAEAYFTVVGELSPPASGSFPIQAAAALCAIATSVLLIAGLRRLGLDPRLAVLWAWCPVVGLQAGNDAHIDVLAAFLAAAALLTLARPDGRRRAIRGGVLLGLAIATKITPILAVPAVLRRRPATVAAAVAAATGAVYLPHLLAVGGRVIGFLPGYLAQDGYASGERFQLLSLVVPESWATLAAVAVLAAVGAAVVHGTDPDRPWRGAVVMTGTALAVTTPSLLWYPMLLVVLVAMDGRAEWLALAAARYLTPLHPLAHYTLADAGRLGYAAALLFVTAVALLRRIRQSGGQHGTPADRTARPAAQPAPAGPSRFTGSGGQPARGSGSSRVAPLTAWPASGSCAGGGLRSIIVTLATSMESRRARPWPPSCCPGRIALTSPRHWPPHARHPSGQHERTRPDVGPLRSASAAAASASRAFRNWARSISCGPGCPGRGG